MPPGHTTPRRGEHTFAASSRTWVVVSCSRPSLGDAQNGQRAEVYRAPPDEHEIIPGLR